MKTIVLGRVFSPLNPDKKNSKEAVYQAFGELLTNQIGVSNLHASIVIDDNGEWWLEDRWSTNGTYIREDDGRFRRIGNHEYPGKCQITPMTYIRLGTDDASGCCFYAKQAEQYGNFNEELVFIKNRHEELDKLGINEKKKIKKISLLIDYVLPLILIPLMCFIIKPLAEEIGGFTTTLVSGYGTFIIMRLSGMMKLLYGVKERERENEEKTKEQKKLFSLCPNPKCNHVLSDMEIANLQCNTCGISHN